MTEQFSSAENEKEKKLRELTEDVERITDKLGWPVDEHIKSTVIALKANGFETTGSCEGHPDRGLFWPWVDVESPLAEQLSNNKEFRKLVEEIRAAGLKQGPEVSKEKKQEYQKLALAQITENEKEYQRLQKLLQEFYGTEGDSGIILGIDKGPWNQSRIEPTDVPQSPPPDRPYEASRKYKEILAKVKPEIKTKKLELYRKEIERFKDFLMKKFLEESSGE